MLHLISHPALQHKLSLLRNKTTPSAEIRRLIDEVSMLLAYEATRDLTVQDTEIETPMGVSLGCYIERQPLIVSILRAGNSMLDGVLKILAEAKVGHIGIYRDRLTQNTVEYYFRLPSLEYVRDQEILLIDPLVATGDTVLASIERLLQFGVGKINILCILISKPALEKIAYFYPKVAVYAIGVEAALNEQGFLIPGMGDVSSRLYGWASEH